MELRIWAGSVLAGAALTAGTCVWAAAAQAETGAGSADHSAASTPDNSSPATDKKASSADSATDDNDASTDDSPGSVSTELKTPAQDAKEARDARDVKESEDPKDQKDSADQTAPESESAAESDTQSDSDNATVPYPTDDTPPHHTPSLTEVTEIPTGVLESTPVVAQTLSAAAENSPAPVRDDPILLPAIATPARDEEVVAAAATPPPALAGDPSFSMVSWLNGEPIIPGSSVRQALHEIWTAQAVLNNKTWGQFNLVAGVAAIVPQLLLTAAQWSLMSWQGTNSAALAFSANTVGIPLIHDLANLTLLSTELLLPQVAHFALQSAQFFAPFVGAFGISAAASQAQQLMWSATSNGRIYAIIPMTMYKKTEPIVYISVNGGPKVPVLVDSGSAGLVMDPRYVGPAGLGLSVYTGTSGYSGGLTYTFNTYETTVDFGQGVTSGITSVNLVSSASQDAFANYFAPAGVVGVLGIGPNAVGPGRALPTAALPGELKSGALLFERLGILVFGPNPLPVRVSVPGAPGANAKVRVDGGPLVSASMIIDSGGVYGTIPAAVLGTGQTSGKVPAGTVVSVYTDDGRTKLYSYRTGGNNTLTVVSDSYMNTGYEPFRQGPVYVGLSGQYGIGTTSFDYA